MYDNTRMGHLYPIASKLNNILEVQNPTLWQNLLEMYDEATRK